MHEERGFTLVEALVATGILVTTLVSLVELFGIAIRSNLAAQTLSNTIVLAEQKIEQLRALSWSVDVHGVPISDTATDTTAVPESPAGGTGLSQSPPNTLSVNTSGFVDYLDRFGNPRGGGAIPPPGGIYIRRWSIEQLPAIPDTLVIQVRVTRGTLPGAGRLPDDAQLITVKTRKPQ